MKELQNILNRLGEGSLLLDKARGEANKIETHNDQDFVIKKILVERLSGILVDCSVLMDELNEMIENKANEMVQMTVDEKFN